jgi:hypothetical protein
LEFEVFALVLFALVEVLEVEIFVLVFIMLLSWNGQSRPGGLALVRWIGSRVVRYRPGRTPLHGLRCDLGASAVRVAGETTA